MKRRQTDKEGFPTLNNRALNIGNFSSTRDNRNLHNLIERAQKYINNKNKIKVILKNGRKKKAINKITKLQPK